MRYTIPIKCMKTHTQDYKPTRLALRRLTKLNTMTIARLYSTSKPITTMVIFIVSLLVSALFYIGRFREVDNYVCVYGHFVSDFDYKAFKKRRI